MFSVNGELGLFRGSARSIHSPLRLPGRLTGIPQRCTGSIIRPLNSVPRRLTSNTTKPTPKAKTDPTTLLAHQRLNRPISPHLTIYRPQITWTVSIATRITGIILSGGVYLYATAYALSPVIGWDVSPESVVRGFGELYDGVKVGVKTLVAWPFLFHCLNGVRHLVWDTGRGLNNRAVIRSGWVVVGVSGVGGVLLGLYRPRGEE